MSSYTCNQCNKPTFLDEGWDSYFCAICNTWNENKCSDSDCCICIGRPDVPLKEDVHSIFLEVYENYDVNKVAKLIEFYFELEAKYPNGRV